MKKSNYNIEAIRALTQDSIGYVQAFNSKGIEYRLDAGYIGHTGGFKPLPNMTEEQTLEQGETYRRICEIADAEIRRAKDAEVMTARAGGNARKGTLALTSRVVTSKFCPVVYQLRLATKRAVAIKKAADEAAARAATTAVSNLNVEATEQAVSLGLMELLNPAPVAAVA